MTNTDNLESSLPTSNLLKMCCSVQVEFCYKLHMSTCSSCLYEVCCTSHECVVDICPYIVLQSIIVYTEVQWDAHLESQEQGWQIESVNAS